jgi:hypothetical protein
MRDIAGTCLGLLLAGGTLLEAQVVKPRPGRIVTSNPAQQPSGQLSTTTQLATGVMLPCCVVEGIDARTGDLLVKDTKSGEVHKIKLGRASGSGGTGAVASAATSSGSTVSKSLVKATSRFRTGQRVDMDIQKTRLAITPFPVSEYKRKKINGNSSWVMKTWVVVSKDGRMDGKTNIKSSEAARGFTGGVEVVLTDRAGNIVYQSKLRTYGVNGTAMGGKSERTINWDETVPPEALNNVRAVVIHHSYEPKVRLAAGINWIKENWKLVHKVYKCGKELYDTAMEDGTKPEGSTPPPPPPPGQPTTQSPPAGNSLMGCLESAGELAEELGY